MTKLLLAAISAFLVASMLPSVVSGASSDPPRIVLWHQVGGIGIGLARARVEHDYGRPGTSASFGRAYALHGGHVFVGYDHSGHVNQIDVDTPYYKAASGFGVRYRMPLGVCHRKNGSCIYTWHGFTYNAPQSNWYRYFVWSGARMQVLITVHHHGLVQEFNFSKLGGAGVWVRPPATAFRAIVAATLHEFCGNTPCNVTVKNVRLAKSDTSYAVDLIQDPKFGNGQFLLHHVHGVWKVVSSGSSQVGCGQAPIKVLDDLRLYCP
jgi:hypothetical protein